MRNTLLSWWQDRLLRGVLRNSGYLFTSNSASILLSMVQGILAARLLGSEGYGILVATVIPFVSNINRLLSFRMSELVVRYLGLSLAEDRKDQAAATVKAAALVECLTSILAFLGLVMVAPLAASYLAKDPSTSPLFILYGLILLSSAVFETSTGVLQSSRLFKSLAIINLSQNALITLFIFLAYIFKGGISGVLLAYLLGKAFAGAATLAAAYRQLAHLLGPGWWRTSLSRAPKWRELAGFAVSTNLSGTINLVTRDSETLFIAFLRSPIEAGYFRIALAVINLVMLPIDPFISATYAEISHTIAQKQWFQTRLLLKRVSTISGVWTLSAGAGLALLGSWLIPVLYGTDFSPAYPAVLILMVGYGFANVLNWNRPLLLALGLPEFPLKAGASTGLVKTILTFWLLPLYGYLVEAAILSAYFLSSIGIIVWRGLSELKVRSIEPQPVHTLR